MPWVRAVLPAPKGPESKTKSPGFNCLPICAPNLCISVRLLTSLFPDTREGYPKKLHEKAGPELTDPAISSYSGISPDTSTQLVGNPDQYLDTEP